MNRVSSIFPGCNFTSETLCYCIFIAQFQSITSIHLISAKLKYMILPRGYLFSLPASVAFFIYYFVDFRLI